MNEYRPNPINTDNIQLPVDLIPLIEQLAENNHEEWATNRVREGWVWGSERCDIKKHHPCLIPYSELPDSEKQYDRVSATSTIKLLLALGYRISK